jgi:TFIIH basal transcription factor complex TTD-A subunit|tara:strand:- start:201 stop:428 length:228 start_codon:yes stop_codon:yes gene_type:complete
MVSAVHGSLIETDIPCKVYILHINEQLPPAERFVIQDLDETHLLVQPHRLEYVKAEVKAWQQKNQFNPPADLRQT